MLLALLSQAGGRLFVFVRDFQTLIGGVIAIIAAFITARPVWRQLDRMSVQTGTMYREFLADRLKALQTRRKTVLDKIDPYRGEVGQRIYEMREFDGGLNIEWVFGSAQDARRLIADLESYRTSTRDPAGIAEALDGVLTRLGTVEDALEDVHRPHSTDQSGEDYSYSDEEWAKVGRKGDAADAALDGLVADFEAASKRLAQAFDAEIDRLRDRLKVTDDALLKKMP